MRILSMLLMAGVIGATPIQAQEIAVTDSNIHHPQGEYVLVNGAKLWYESEGDGEPLLLLAGGPGSSHLYFHPWFSVLADSFRIIYFDAFGRGKSERASTPSEYRFDRDVEDVDGLRKALGLKMISIFGLSYGGMVAQAYALKYPASVQKLILASTLFSGEMWQANNDSYNYEVQNQYPEVWEKLQHLRASGIRSSAQEYQDAQAPVSMALCYYYNPSNAAKLTREFNPDVYFAMVGEDADFRISGDIAKLDFRNELRKLRMPILILAGRFDRIVLPRYSLRFKEYAPQAEFVMFERSGHLTFIEETDSTFNLVRRFLKDGTE